MLKKSQVVMLPTNNTINVLKGYTDKSLLFKYRSEYKSVPAEIKYVSYFHLYIISDDEIKEGDWCIHPTTLNISQHHSKNNNLTQGWKKIIATTDTSLTNQCIRKDGTITDNYSNVLPQPSQQFIEKYIEEYNKSNIIKDVLVEYEEDKFNYKGSIGNTQRIFNLKINLKDNTITIKKLKDSWNREEVYNLLYKIYDDAIGIEKPIDEEFNNWIKENL